MKQLRIESMNGRNPETPIAAAPDSKWVDDIAALLSDELRLGWYRNIKPWIAGLSPEDEVAHLAYAVGDFGLLIRDCPSLVGRACQIRRHTATTLEGDHGCAEHHGRLPSEARGSAKQLCGRDSCRAEHRRFQRRGCRECPGSLPNVRYPASGTIAERRS